MSQVYDVIVVGGGAAGMFSAATAASLGSRVLLLEKTPRWGWKLSITGKGRCNVTNDCGPEEVLKNIPTNPRFLYSSLWGFPPEETKALFERLGVPLKTERGQRVFPVSDKAGDIVSALLRYVDDTGVVRKRGAVSELLTQDGCICGVRTEKETYRAAKVILATGGKSYPNTGSTGDGYWMAERLGHTITPISGSLVPLEIMGGECRKMAGLSLRNVGLKLYGKKKKPVYSDFGEALFMSYGLSGPIILSASAHMDEKNGPYELELDLKPALDEKKLEARLLRDFEARKNEHIYEGIRGLLPGPLVPVILDRCEIPSNCPVNSITREQRRRILETVKALRFSVAGKRPVEEAIITHGGVKVSEVDPSTMESKLVPGLYFAGEILDCDAYTGGFNLQIAWSTAFAAGTSCGNLQEAVL
jgi:hypothetical protein